MNIEYSYEFITIVLKYFMTFSRKLKTKKQTQYYPTLPKEKVIIKTYIFQVYFGKENGIELWSWRLSLSGMSLEAIYSTPKGTFSSLNINPSYDQLTPVSFSFKGNGKLLVLLVVVM